MLRPLRISLSRTEHRALTRVAALAVFSRRISAYRLHSPTVSLGAASWEWANRCPTGGIGAELSTSAMHFFVRGRGYTITRYAQAILSSDHVPRDHRLRYGVR